MWSSRASGCCTWGSRCAARGQAAEWTIVAVSGPLTIVGGTATVRLGFQVAELLRALATKEEIRLVPIVSADPPGAGREAVEACVGHRGAWNESPFMLATQLKSTQAGR